MGWQNHLHDQLWGQEEGEEGAILEEAHTELAEIVEEVDIEEVVGAVTYIEKTTVLIIELLCQTTKDIEMTILHLGSNIQEIDIAITRIAEVINLTIDTFVL